MIEILAQNIENLFTENTGIKGIRTYGPGDLYDVYEVSDADFEKINAMSEEEFEKICPDGMWRYAKGSIMPAPDATYTINGVEILAWDGATRQSYYNDYCRDCSDRVESEEILGRNCMGNDEDICKCLGDRIYPSLIAYFVGEMHLSQPKNVCALSVDLARYNNMKMSELFNKVKVSKFDND